VKLVFPALDDETVDQIKYGLPSPKILSYATTTVIKHPLRDEYVILKWRLPSQDTEELTESSFQELNEIRTWYSDWRDLFGRHLIINPSMLTRNAQKALKNLK
jgi:hypothetical protein